jgi:hypothetical protein
MSLLLNVIVKAVFAAAARQSVLNRTPWAVTCTSVPLGEHRADGAEGGAVGELVGGAGGLVAGAVVVTTGAGADSLVGEVARNAATAPTAVPAMAARESSAHSACHLLGRLHRTIRAPARMGMPNARAKTTLSLEMMAMLTSNTLPIPLDVGREAGVRDPRVAWRHGRSP